MAKFRRPLPLYPGCAIQLNWAQILLATASLWVTTTSWVLSNAATKIQIPTKSNVPPPIFNSLFPFTFGLPSSSWSHPLKPISLLITWLAEALKSSSLPLKHSRSLDLQATSSHRIPCPKICLDGCCIILSPSASSCNCSCSCDCNCGP